MKEIVIETTIPSCTVKEFFALLYADGRAAAQYHREYDKDDNAIVGKWMGNKREVQFTIPMQLPAVITAIVGSNAIPVREVQTVETDESGILHVTSLPIIGVPGGSKFTATAEITVANAMFGEASCCKVRAQVTCEAAGPWGMAGTIEGIMVQQSATSVQGYLDFCTKYCRLALADKMQDAAEDGPLSPRSDATAFDHFFDAQEVLSRQSSGLSSSGLDLGPGSGTEGLDMIAFLQLLDTLEGRLAQVGGDLAALRGMVRPSARVQGLPSRFPTRSPSRLGPWLLGLACGAAGMALLSVGARFSAALLRRRS